MATRLTREQVDTIAANLTEGASPSDLAVKFGVSRPTIYAIKRKVSGGEVSSSEVESVNFDDHQPYTIPPITHHFYTGEPMEVFTARVKAEREEYLKHKDEPDAFTTPKGYDMGTQEIPPVPPMKK